MMGLNEYIQVLERKGKKKKKKREKEREKRGRI